MPGNLFSAAALAAKVYLRPRGINQEVPGAKKGVPEPMESGAESDGQRVSSCGNRGGKQWKVGRLVMENGSESGGKWVSKQKKGLLSAPKRSFKCSQRVSSMV